MKKHSVLLGLTIALLASPLLCAQQSEQSSLMLKRLEMLSNGRGVDSNTLQSRFAYESGTAMEPVEQRVQALGERTPDEKVASISTTIIDADSLSAIELDYNQRYRQMVNPRASRLVRHRFLRADVLHQYGYDVFRSVRDQPVRGRRGNYAVGAVSPSYVLGIGDELIFSFSGTLESVIYVTVDSEGRVILPNVGPLAVAGQSFGEFQQLIKQRISSSMIGTRISVSLGRVKQIQVLVTGQVERPGRYRLNGFGTLFDALAAAHGVARNGSLRTLVRIRAGQRKHFDLYDLLQGRIAADLGLADGDRLVVPPIGRTFAVAGDVVRAGIYELLPQERVSVRDALALAGGEIRMRGNRYMRVAADAQGAETVISLNQPVKRRAGERGQEEWVNPGDLLIVQRPDQGQSGEFRLMGHVHNEGVHSIARYPTIKALLGQGNVYRESPYLLFAAISRVDEHTRSRQWQALNLAEVVFTDADLPLREDDVVVVLGQEDIDFLNSSEIRSVLLREGSEPVADEDSEETEQQRVLALLRGDKPNLAIGECPGMLMLSRLLERDEGGRFQAARRSISGSYAGSLSQASACPMVFSEYPDLLPFTLEHVLSISGEVRAPGGYPVVGEIGLSELLAVVGGTTSKANRRAVSVSRSRPDGRTGRVQTRRFNLSADAQANLQVDEADGLLPGDFVQVASLISDMESGPVVLSGQFKLPGLYDISRGERLSSVIARAGGLADNAYPYGAVFTRRTIVEEEGQWLQHRVADIEDAMILSVSKAQVRGKPATGVIELLNSLKQRLENTQPLGRMMVEADPAVLSVRPVDDFVLQPDDRLHIPKRPVHITVTGEVLSSGAVRYQPTATVADYINQSGGFRESADEDRMFVVLPNGRAQPVRDSWWTHTSVRLAPGSVVVVPRDPVPFDFMALGLDISDLLSKVALTAASLNALSE